MKYSHFLFEIVYVLVILYTKKSNSLYFIFQSMQFFNLIKQINTGKKYNARIGKKHTNMLIIFMMIRVSSIELK